MNGLAEKARACFYERARSRGLKESSVQRKARELERFLDYAERGLKKDLREISAGDIEEYFLSLRERGLSGSTLETARGTLTDMFMGLEARGLIMLDPMEMTDIVIREKSGKKTIFSENEMEDFLNAIDPATGCGLRDRCVFELMYVTGMRIGEAVKLNTDDIDFSHNEVLIRQGKGRKDRIVPLGTVAKRFLEKWVKKVRPYFLKKASEDDGALFLSAKGTRASQGLVRWRMRRYLKEAGIAKEGLTPHSIRHSTATHLLRNGADIVFVAELLGHESLVTTQAYTSQIVDGLKKTHKTYHPRENELYPEDI